jgi:hypothetical protein
VFIYVANKFVIYDTAGFTAFSMLVWGGVYMDNANFIVHFQHVCPVSPYSTHIAIAAFIGTVVTRLDLLP